MKLDYNFLLAKVIRLGNEIEALHQQASNNERYLTLLESANQTNINERDEAYTYIGRLAVNGGDCA